MFSLVVMTAVIIGYTVLGGIKAVIYTDTIQWIVLLCGLLVANPFALFHVGGWTAMREALPAHYFRLTALRPVQFINWMVTIVPIWFIGMTLYQRAYACRTEKGRQACLLHRRLVRISGSRFYRSRSGHDGAGFFFPARKPRWACPC